jgi:erythromycin esterase-like protein
MTGIADGLPGLIRMASDCGTQAISLLREMLSEALAMKWRTSTMAECVEFMRERESAGEWYDYRRITGFPPDCEESGTVEGVMFTDGTVVAVEAVQARPYSEVTPDPDYRPPEWYIYD